MLWPRVYLYEEVDMYAIHDLEDIHNGKMLALLNSAVRFARSHILSCVLCSGKGFICEVCRGKLIMAAAIFSYTFKGVIFRTVKIEK